MTANAMPGDRADDGGGVVLVGDSLAVPLPRGPRPRKLRYRPGRRAARHRQRRHRTRPASGAARDARRLGEGSALTGGKKAAILHFDAHAGAYEKLDHFFGAKKSAAHWGAYLVRQGNMDATKSVQIGMRGNTRTLNWLQTSYDLGYEVCLMPTKEQPNKITSLVTAAVMLEMIALIADSAAGG